VILTEGACHLQGGNLSKKTVFFCLLCAGGRSCLYGCTPLSDSSEIGEGVATEPLASFFNEWTSNSSLSPTDTGRPTTCPPPQSNLMFQDIFCQITSTQTNDLLSCQYSSQIVSLSFFYFSLVVPPGRLSSRGFLSVTASTLIRSSFLNLLT
jgi:hypothetical protein